LETNGARAGIEPATPSDFLPADRKTKPRQSRTDARKYLVFFCVLAQPQFEGISSKTAALGRQLLTQQQWLQ
jgi:hypothetical protein